MTQYTHTAEGGTDGAAVTVGNSGGGSGDPFGLVQIAGAGSVTYSSVGKAHGNLGYRLTGTGAAADRVYVRTVITSTSQASVRLYFTLNTLPSKAQNLFVLTDGTSQLMGVGLLAGNTMRVIDAAGASLGTYATVLSTNTLYRLEFSWKKGTSTTDGQIAAKVFLGDATTEVFSYAATNVNAGTVNAQHLNNGVTTGSAIIDMTLDTILVDDAQQTFLGPNVVAPTAAVVPAAVVSGTGWTAVGGSDIPTALADGLDSSYALSPDTPVNSTLIVQSAGNLTSGNVVVTPRMSKRDTSTVATAKVTLLNSAGTAVAAEQTYTLTTSPTTYTYSLTSAENTALTSRSAPQWRIIANA